MNTIACIYLVGFHRLLSTVSQLPICVYFFFLIGYTYACIIECYPTTKRIAIGQYLWLIQNIAIFSYLIKICHALGINAFLLNYYSIMIEIFNTHDWCNIQYFIAMVEGAAWPYFIQSEFEVVWWIEEIHPQNRNQKSVRTIGLVNRQPILFHCNYYWYLKATSLLNINICAYGLIN